MADFFPGFEAAADHDLGRRDQPGDRRQRAAAPVVARLSADPCCCGARSRRGWRRTSPLVIPDLRGYGDSSKPPAGAGLRRLFEARAGAGPGRDDERARLRALCRRRARPRRPRHPPAAARPSRADRARRAARHRADALPLRDDRPEGRDRQLALVLPDPAGAASRSG